MKLKNKKNKSMVIEVKIYAWGSARHKLLAVRQAQRCTVQQGKYSQYFVITINGKWPLKLYKNIKI